VYGGEVSGGKFFFATEGTENTEGKSHPAATAGGSIPSPLYFRLFSVISVPSVANAFQ